MKHERIRHQSEKPQVAKAHKRKIEKAKKPSFLLSKADTEYTSSQYTPPTQTYRNSRSDEAQSAARKEL